MKKNHVSWSKVNVLLIAAMVAALCGTGAIAETEYRYYYYHCENLHRWPYASRYCTICGGYINSSTMKITWTSQSPYSMGYSAFENRYAFTLGLDGGGMWFFEYANGLDSQTRRDLSSSENLSSGDVFFVYCTATSTDTLSGIAMYYYGDTSFEKDIAAFNGISLSTPIYEGMLLMIPNPVRTRPKYVPRSVTPYVVDGVTSTEYVVYVVKSGDTLTDIAFDLLDDQWRYTEIAVANNMKPPYMLSIGRELLIPYDPTTMGQIIPEVLVVNK